MFEISTIDGFRTSYQGSPVALANRMARIAWALMATGRRFETPAIA
jgi:hypothetical protein